VAVSCTDCPGATLAVDGVMETLATGAGGLVTVTLDVPDTPAVEAVVVAVPTLAPATRPFELTVATVPLLLVQANVCPDMTLPPASCAVAVSWIVLPACTLAGFGATDTVATAGAASVTVITA
jgi:hypothetical protein